MPRISEFDSNAIWNAVDIDTGIRRRREFEVRQLYDNQLAQSVQGISGSREIPSDSKLIRVPRERERYVVALCWNDLLIGIFLSLI